MGFLDSIFGSEPELKFEQSGQQRQLGGAITPFLTNLFQQQNPWQSFMPTGNMMGQLPPELVRGAFYGVERGADQLQERLAGMGFSGGSGMAGMSDYYSQSVPQVNFQLANMMTQAMAKPYSLASSLYGQTLPTPVVSPGSPGMMSSMFQMGAPFAMSHLPWGNFGGLMGGGGA
jgi:hypothetical protein